MPQNRRLVSTNRNSLLGIHNVPTLQIILHGSFISYRGSMITWRFMVGWLLEPVYIG